jgi:hypothetical protein
MVERRIDMTYMVWAWQDDSPDNSYYLDTRTGDIRLVNRNLLDLNDLTDEIERNRERFHYLPKPDKQLLLADLHDFAQSVEDQKTKATLAIAFESPHVLSAFHKILEDSPHDLKRLTGFIDERVQKRIRAWLKANSIKEVWQDAEEEDFPESSDRDDDYEWEDFSVRD